MSITVGMTALQLLFEIVKKNSAISSVTFAIYKPVLGFKGRIAKTDPSLMNKLNSGMSCDVPKEIYWNPSLDFEEQALVVKELMHHDAEDEFKRRTKLNIKNFTWSKMDQIISNLSEDQTLAICSICEMENGETSHIPMMDFACEINDRNLELLKKLIELLELNGAILESGKSYHFYGFDLINHEKWLKLMANFLLAAPLTDLRYIAHRILGDACVLRITSTPLKPTVPTVKAIVGKSS